MHLKRDIYNNLLSWKRDSRGRTALLIEGARRVGKSTTAQSFGRDNYASCLHVDLSIAPKSIRQNFEENLNDLDKFFQILSLEYATPLHRRDSLIIFDEIQTFPKAREAIKHLVADGRYDFIETGSLISIKENVRGIILPSEEEHLRMYPLTFPEFLRASGETPLLEYIRECFAARMPLEDAFHRRATHLIREYMLVGGMPQSVVAFLEGDRDFRAADRQKRLILDLYRDDIKKAARRYKSKVSALFEHLPAYLSTHEKKVVLSKISANGEFEQYDDPLFWLGDSMICNLCYRCSDPRVGLALNLDDSSVKCYMGDTGLLVSLAFSENQINSSGLYNSILNGRLSLNEGMLHENLVAQTIASASRSLYFYTHYSKEKHRNDIEIDFLLSDESRTNPKIVPVEVKSSKNYTALSYEKFRKRFGRRAGESIIVHPKAFSADKAGIRIPTYMVFCAVE